MKVGARLWLALSDAALAAVTTALGLTALATALGSSSAAPRGAGAALALCTLLGLLVAVPAAALLRLSGSARQLLRRVVVGGPPSRVGSAWLWLVPFFVFGFALRQTVLRYGSARLDLVEPAAELAGLGGGAVLAVLAHRVVPSVLERVGSRSRAPRLPEWVVLCFLFLVSSIAWIRDVPLVVPSHAPALLTAVVVAGVCAVAALLARCRARPGRGEYLGRAAATVTVLALLTGLGPAIRRTSRHPLVPHAAAAVHAALDLDRDGFSALLPPYDCDDLDARVHPLAEEIVGNGLDDNCRGGDLAEVPTLPETAPRATRPPPDVVLVSVDTLRADHLDPAVMPETWRFAETARRFTNAHAVASFTDLSLRSTFSGWPPSDFDDGGSIVGMDVPLAAVLGDVGYRTFAAHSVVEMGELVTLGFQVLNDSLESRHLDRGGVSAPDLVELALQVLRAPMPGPRLLWVHFLEPHYRYLAHAGFERFGDSTAGRYRQEVAFLDAALAPLFDWLSRPDVAARTVVVFFADHGEYLGEQGRLGHDLSLFPPVTRVPLFIRSPGLAPGSVDDPVSLLDLFPTVIELTGLAGVEPRAGVSLVDASPPRPLLLETRLPTTGYTAVAYRDGPDLLHCWERSQLCELCDTTQDPSCTRDAGRERTARFDALRAALAERIDHYRNDRRRAERRRRWVSRYGKP